MLLIRMFKYRQRNNRQQQRHVYICSMQYISSRIQTCLPIGCVDDSCGVFLEVQGKKDYRG